MLEDELDDDDEDDEDAEPELESSPHAAMSVENAAAPPAPPIIFMNFLREESSRTSSSSAPPRDTSGPASVVVTGRTSRSVCASPSSSGPRPGRIRARRSGARRGARQIRQADADHLESA